MSLEYKSKILVVDDEPQVRDIFKLCLEKKGYEVDTAVNGKEAYAMARKQVYDCIVTDKNMPVMDGLEFARKLRVNGAITPNSVPIIMISGDSHSVKSYQNIDKLLEKPIQMKTLTDIVDSYLLY